MSKPIVLLIEDQALLALHLRSIVRAAGYDVAGPVARLGEALELASCAPLDAALLDVNLSRGEDSFPAAEQLKARGIPFAFVTAHRDKLPAAFAESPVIAKPFADRDIATILATLLVGKTDAATAPAG
jgi:CheY-like chemotaxis protein